MLSAFRTAFDFGVRNWPSNKKAEEEAGAATDSTGEKEESKIKKLNKSLRAKGSNVLEKLEAQQQKRKEKHDAEEAQKGEEETVAEQKSRMPSILQKTSTKQQAMYEDMESTPAFSRETYHPGNE